MRIGAGIDDMVWKWEIDLQSIAILKSKTNAFLCKTSGIQHTLNDGPQKLVSCITFHIWFLASRGCFYSCERGKRFPALDSSRITPIKSPIIPWLSHRGGMKYDSELLIFPFSSCPSPKWGFPQMGVPPKHPFINGIFPYKPSINGVPPFMQTLKYPQISRKTGGWKTEISEISAEETGKSAQAWSRRWSSWRDCFSRSKMVQEWHQHQGI